MICHFSCRVGLSWTLVKNPLIVVSQPATVFALSGSKRNAREEDAAFFASLQILGSLLLITRPNQFERKDCKAIIIVKTNCRNVEHPDCSSFELRMFVNEINWTAISDTCSEQVRSLNRRLGNHLENEWKMKPHLSTAQIAENII